MTVTKPDPYCVMVDAEYAERIAGDKAGACQLAYYTALAGFGEGIPFDAALYATLPELEAAYSAAVDAWHIAHVAAQAARSKWLQRA